LYVIFKPVSRSLSLLDAAPHKADEGSEQGEAAAHRLEDDIVDQRHGDVARACDDAGRDTEAAAIEEGESPREKGDRVEDAGKPGFETRRCGACGSCHGFLASLIGFYGPMLESANFNGNRSRGLRLMFPSGAGRITVGIMTAHERLAHCATERRPHPRSHR